VCACFDLQGGDNGARVETTRRIVILSHRVALRQHPQGREDAPRCTELGARAVGTRTAIARCDGVVVQVVDSRTLSPRGYPDIGARGVSDPGERPVTEDSRIYAG